MPSTNAVERIVSQIRERKRLKSPFIVALDGGSGSGKSSIGGSVARAMGAVLIQADVFFAAGISSEEWEQKTPEQRAKDALDWRRLRAEVLQPLTQARAARWKAFDFASGPLPNGAYRMQTEFKVALPQDIVIIDGAYSSRHELADLLDFTILVDVPASERHFRLSGREATAFLAAWHRRWDAAEEHYFTTVRPPTSFDLVVWNDRNA